MADSFLVNHEIFPVGARLFITTTTKYFVGRVKVRTHDFVVLEDAAWVADTGRFNVAMSTGDFDDVEPYVKPVAISILAIIDVTEYVGNLPLGVK